MGTRARERERETESARVDALTQSRMDWRTRSSLHRRMIELYLKHRDRLINILEMIDGKERCVCVYLSKIVQWKQRAAATRAVRAGARTRAHTKKRAIDPWSPAEGFEKGWKKSPCTFPADDIFFFFFFFGAHPRALRNYLWPSNRRFATNNFRISSNFCSPASMQHFFANTRA